MKKRLILGAVGCLVWYAAFWVLYYGGFTSLAVILGLAIFPCAAFFLYSLARKNHPAAILALAFALCHVVSSVMKAAAA